MADMFLAQRLHTLIAAAGIPIDGVSVGDPATRQASVQFKPAATPAQRTQAATLIASFDWSQAASDTFKNALARTTAVSQLSTGVEAADKLLRAVVLVLLDEINLIRAAASVALAARTAAQVRTAVINKINAGDAD